MADLTLNEIAAKAMALCEQDGFKWEAVLSPVVPHDPISPPLISDSMRRGYLRKAEQLLKAEASDA